MDIFHYKENKQKSLGNFGPYLARITNNCLAEKYVETIFDWFDIVTDCNLNSLCWWGLAG